MPEMCIIKYAFIKTNSKMESYKNAGLSYSSVILEESIEDFPNILINQIYHCLT